MYGEKACLYVEGLRKAVVPNHEVGALDLPGQGQLGGDHAFSKGRGKVARVNETAALDGRGAGDDDDFIEMRLSGGFKQKGDINGQPRVAWLAAN